ncbi:MAG: hypothetical protein LBT86_09930 [Deltaproteobacteria bacterium]|nr:hypothetical protein [Deltaproteobacteria bacterium]
MSNPNPKSSSSSDCPNAPATVNQVTSALIDAARDAAEAEAQANPVWAMATLAGFGVLAPCQF